MIPKISMVIPVYNGGKFLHQALDNILTQTMQDFEIICVDDCSTDSSREIIKEYAARDKRVKYIFHDKNKFTLQSRKDGALYSSGQYVMFMDQDDYFEPNAFEVACRAIEERGTDLVQFGTIVENCGDLPEQIIISYNKRMQFQEEETVCGNLPSLWFIDQSKRKMTVVTWNKIYTGELCKKAFAAIEDGIFPNIEDYYSTFLILYYAESAAIIKDNLYHYRFGSGFTGHTSVSVKEISRYCKGILVFDAVRRFVANLPDSEQKELAPSIGFIKTRAVNRLLGAFNRLPPDDMRVENLQAMCSSLGPDAAACIIACLRERQKESLYYPDISFARIDIKNEGANTNDIDIVEISDPDAKITEPGWICKNGHGYVVKSTAGSLDMKLKCTGQGKLMITLRGMDVRKPDGERWPLWIDYTKFIVDDKVMFDGVKPIWHDKPYRFATEAEDGKVVTVHIEWVTDCVSIGPGKVQSRDMQNQAIKDAKAKTAIEHKCAVELNTKLKDANAAKKELNTQLKDAKAANEKLERELANIRSGMSFRIGRAITYIPRKILGKK